MKISRLELSQCDDNSFETSICLTYCIRGCLIDGELLLTDLLFNTAAHQVGICNHFIAISCSGISLRYTLFGRMKGAQTDGSFHLTTAGLVANYQPTDRPTMERNGNSTNALYLCT